MNFYKLDQLLMKENLHSFKRLRKIRTDKRKNLIAKFQAEEPGLSTDMVSDYLNKFNKTKSELSKHLIKDIDEYSWKELKTIIDDYSKRMDFDPNIL